MNATPQHITKRWLAFVTACTVLGAFSAFAADNDGDDMDDDWEVLHFGSTNALAAADADGDGYLNVYEYVGESDPTNALSEPAANRIVDPGDTNAYAVIQDALDDVEDDYEIIVVVSGTYTNSGDYDLDFGGAKATLVAEDGPLACSISPGFAGRGFYFHNSEDNLSVVAGLTVTGAGSKTSVIYGGGLNCSGGSPTLIRCRIIDCSAGVGSGVYCSGSTPRLWSCVIATNMAGPGPGGRSGGAGVYSGGGAHPSLRNCAIVHNRASFIGGGIWGGYSSVENSIIWGNYAIVGPQIYGSPSVTYSDVQGGYAGTGNITNDPLFVAGTYQLSADSPCIDAGTSNAVYYDVEGDPRWDIPEINNVVSEWDIGADEFSDYDADGMDDWWESEYLGGTNAAPTDDADDDGYLEIYEFVHDSDPTEATSLPAGTHFVAQTGSHATPFSSWATASTNIQEALNVATNGLDVVLVTDGEYTGTLNKNLAFPSIPAMLASTGGWEYCTINCEANGRGVLFDGGQDLQTVFAGFTVEHGSNVTYGAGIYCVTSSPTLWGCNLEDNWATGGGGAALAATNSAFRLINSRAWHNWGRPFGGALYLVDCDAVISGASIRYNNTHQNEDGQLGGGIYASNSILQIADSLVSGNDGSYYGGGIYAAGGVLTVEDSTVSRSLARHGGGGICVAQGAELTIRRCLIEYNRSRYRGGGLYLDDVGGLIENTVIRGSLAMRKDTGDPLGQGGGLFLRSTSPLLVNTTVIDNGSDLPAGNGGGIYDDASTTATNRNCILWNNTPDQLVDGSASTVIEYCCIQDWTAGGTGNFANNPQLRPQDFRLLTNSPCIDAGTSSGAPAQDIDAEDRWDDPDHPGALTYDVGADELVDDDDDGMADVWEIQYFGSTNESATADWDEDGMTNVVEYLVGTLPDNQDTDDDGLLDGAELTETTDPLDADSDNDGMPDGWEVLYGLSPVSDTGDDGPDSDVSDGDLFLNLEEYNHGTHPDDVDTDDDGVSDYCEVENGSDPTSADDFGTPGYAY